MVRATTAIAMVAVALWFDYRERRIPNQLVLMGVAAGFALGLATGGLRGLGASALGLVVGGAILFVPFALGWMGGGDVKLLAAIGAILGAKGAAVSMLYGAIAGGVMSAAVLARRRRLGATFAAIGVGLLGFVAYLIPGIVGRNLRMARRAGEAMQVPTSGAAIPYSAAIGIGLVIAVATGL